MESITVEQSIWINAPRQRVWQAATDPGEIAQWLLPGAMTAMGAGMSRDENDRLIVNMGPMAVNIAAFEQLEPPRRASLRPLPEALLIITYTLEETDGGTRLTVTMAGFDALPDDAARERIAPSAAGWQKALANLKAYVEGAAQPHPEGHVSSLFGYRRQTPAKVLVERSIWINAPRQRVWQAITDPQQIGQWFSPGTEWGGTGLEVGGRLFVYDPETRAELYPQVIDLVDEPYQLATSEADTDTPHTTLWTLTDEQGGTRLTITHSGYEFEPEADRHNNMEQNTFGFGMMLENVKAVIEGAELPVPGGF